MNGRLVAIGLLLLAMWVSDGSDAADEPARAARPAVEEPPEEPVRPNDINALLGYPDQDSRAHFIAPLSRP